MLSAIGGGSKEGGRVRSQINECRRSVESRRFVFFFSSGGSYSRPQPTQKFSPLPFLFIPPGLFLQWQVCYKVAMVHHFARHLDHCSSSIDFVSRTRCRCGEQLEIDTIWVCKELTIVQHEGEAFLARVLAGAGRLLLLFGGCGIATTTSIGDGRFLDRGKQPG